MKLRAIKLKNEEEDEVRGAISTPRTILFLVGTLVFFAVLMGGLYRYRSSPAGPFRREYEGKIVEKWARYAESEQGSKPLFRLLVEDNNKVRFTVAVTPDVYERAEIGMRIKKSESGIELLADGSKVISVGPANTK